MKRIFDLIPVSGLVAFSPMYLLIMTMELLILVLVALKIDAV